ncbi:MAG TPA: DUF2442 domain-containing protein [Longimicrobium sp.]|jgi:hypothetical protein
MIYENLNLSDEEIDRILAESRRLRELEGPNLEPRAVRAWYDAERDLVMFEMRNGCVFGFPSHEGQGLENATPEQLAEVDAVTNAGVALHWEELDADISVPGIMFDLLNVRGWYAKWLGSATSEAKAAAARENGKKGGRPRTKAPASQRSRRSGGATSGD